METSTRSSPANFFSRLWAFIMHRMHRGCAKPASTKDPVITPATVTAETLIDSLDPEGLGKMDGQRNDPPPSGGRRGSGEHRIIVRICDLRQEWEEHANFWICKHNDDVRDAMAGDQKAGIDSLLANAKQKLTNFAQHGHRSINEIERQVGDSLKRETAESERYGCEGEPEKGGDFVYHLTYVVAFFVVETLVNGYFLGVRSTGLLEGWALASLISFLNGAIGFTMAYKCKSIIHEIGVFRKVVGWLIVCSGFVFLAFVNLLVGHIRDRLSEDNLDPTIATSGVATRYAVEQVFGFQPMLYGESYLMAGVGGLVAILAVIAGWTAQSPHPRYLQAFEQHKERRERLLRERRRFDVEYSEMFRQFLDQFRAAEERAYLLNKPKECRYFDKAKNVKDMAAARIQSLERSGEQILAMYRSANEKERGSKSRRVSWSINEWPTLSIDDVVEPPTFLQREREEESAEVTCEDAAEKLEQHFNELKEQFPW